MPAAKKLDAMLKRSTPARRLSQGEQRALAAFIAGRLPAGQLDDELRRARETAVAQAAAQAQPAAVGAPALNAA